MATKLFLFRAFCVLVLVVGAVSFAQATLVMVVEESSSGDQLAYADQMSATDLIDVSQATFVSATSMGYTPISDAADPGGPDNVLNDGDYGRDGMGVSPGYQYWGEAAFDIDDVWSVTYSLNTTLKPEGYDLATIDVFTGEGGKRDAQHYKVYVDYVGGSSNVLLGDFQADGLKYDEGPNFTTHTQLANDTGGAFATGVSAITFELYGSFPADWGNIGNVYREIDVQGVPEPSTLVLLACGLFGLLAYAWRKRR